MVWFRRERRQRSGGWVLTMTAHEIELSARTIQYQDSGGKGPAIVLLHGFLMDASSGDQVIPELSPDHRPPGTDPRAGRAPSSNAPRRRPVAAGDRPARRGLPRPTRPPQRHPGRRRHPFDRPALIVWARQDRVMPPEHGRRLPRSSRKDAWSRSPTATSSSSWTSLPGSPSSSGTSSAADAAGWPPATRPARSRSGRWVPRWRRRRGCAGPRSKRGVGGSA
jgi:pimeloyl-ACP methyl ester carboxylesterase